MSAPPKNSGTPRPTDADGRLPDAVDRLRTSAVDTHFLDLVAEHRRLLRKRGFAMAAEDIPPTGQADLWHADVVTCMPPSGRAVARQLARLCAWESEVIVPWRSLADAVGIADRDGRIRAYTERGVEILVQAGWLHVESFGRGCKSFTVFSLMPGDRHGWHLLDEQHWLEEAA